MAKTNVLAKADFIDVIEAAATQFGKVLIKQIDNADTSYTGLVIEKIGVPSPVVNLDRLYADYCNGKTMCWCIDKTKEILNMTMNIPFAPADMLNWNKVKDRLFLRLVGNISDGIYRCIADMYLVPYVSVSEEEGMAARITPELLDEWNIDEDTLFEQAQRNQETLRPVKIESLASRLGLPETGVKAYVVGTKHDWCGASAILYNGVVDKIKEKIGNFYIIPSSIHEVIVIPKSEETDINNHKRLVNTANETAVEDKDVLTNSIYTYDFTAREIIKIA
jgi:hypothetical protein